jgi:methionine synthase I (cobalamin-dependent)
VQQLTQAMLDKVHISLSETCDKQAEVEASWALHFNPNQTGKFYKFSVPKPSMREFRMTFIGDSITVGCCGTTLDKMNTFSEHDRLMDNKLGYWDGNVNAYPSLLL